MAGMSSVAMSVRSDRACGGGCPFLPPGDGGTGHPSSPAVQPHGVAFVYLCPLWAHLDPRTTAPVDVEHGPGHVLPGAVMGSAQVRRLIGGLDGRQAQDAAADFGLLRELAAGAPIHSRLGMGFPVALQRNSAIWPGCTVSCGGGWRPWGQTRWARPARAVWRCPGPWRTCWSQCTRRCPRHSAARHGWSGCH